MGCDIHAHVEIKIHGRWEHYNCSKDSRCYRLFAKMAGVKNPQGDVPISNPKGAPEDISTVTRFDMEEWDDDGHSHSYLTASELVELSKWYIQYTNGKSSLEEDYFGYLFGNSLASFTEHPEDNVIGLEDVRIVFWFDN